MSENPWEELYEAAREARDGFKGTDSSLRLWRAVDAVYRVKCEERAAIEDEPYSVPALLDVISGLLKLCGDNHTYGDDKGCPSCRAVHVLAHAPLRVIKT